jgi:hypothetical protein
MLLGLNAMKQVLAIIGATLVLVAASSPSAAQGITLSVSPSTFTYPSASPDTSPVVTSPQLTLSYRVTGNGGRAWTITVQAQTDLVSGSSSIPAGNVTWTATPAPFVNGTLSTTAQTLAQGSGTVSTTKFGYLTFNLKNLWTYAAGTYSHTVVFTFSAG